jgi:PST family polysaccharide transporter
MSTPKAPFDAQDARPASSTWEGVADAAVETQPALTIGAAAAFGLLTSVSGVGFAVLRSKVMALRLGPEGLGQIAEINQLVALANVATSTMAGTVLINQLARARAAGDEQAIRRVVGAAWAGALLVSVLAAFAAVIAGRFALPQPWGPAAWPFTALAALATVLATVGGVNGQTLVVFERLDKSTALNIATNVLQTTLIVGALAFFGIGGFFTAGALAALLVLPLWFRALRRHIPTLAQLPRLRLDREYLVQAVRLGGTALTASALGQGMFTCIRWLLERHGGPELNGQYQAASTVGNQYFAMVLTGLSSFTFPRYAAAQSAEDLTDEIKKTCTFIFRVAPAVVLGGIAFRDVAVRLLYSLRFASAADLLGWQMTGDLSKAISWAVAGPLLLRGRVRAYLVCEILGVGIHAVASLALIPRFGLIGEGYAQVMAYVVYGFIALAVVRRSCGVRLSYAPVLATLPLTAAAIGVMLATRHWPGARWAAAVLAIAWAERAGLVRDAWRTVRRRMARLLG